MNITITRRATTDEIRMLRARPCATPGCPFIARGYSDFCEACEECAKPYCPGRVEAQTEPVQQSKWARYLPALITLVIVLALALAGWLDGTTEVRW